MLCHHVDLGYPTKYFETYISDHEKILLTTHIELY
jgi:hypothetical protein